MPAAARCNGGRRAQHQTCTDSLGRQPRLDFQVCKSNLDKIRGRGGSAPLIKLSICFQHPAGHCTECGRRPYHVPCIQTYLEKKLFKEIREGGSGTKSIEKVKMKIAQRPQELMYKK